MIFDDVNRPSSTPEPPRRRRRRRSPREHASGGPEHRRSRSSFEKASRFSESTADRGDRSTAAWLWMLGLLVAITAGFAFYLQQQKAARTPLPGEAPSERLLAFVDPILAPLETGTGGYDPAKLDEVTAQIQADAVGANLDDREVYGTAATMASILQEAAQDRARHMQRLVDLGSPVIGLSEGGVPKNPSMTDAQKQHLELAVGVSWQRNSGTYRNRVEELWYRLLGLEQGRFQGGSASPAMVPPNPSDQ
jgi:hypothetical protein